MKTWDKLSFLALFGLILILSVIWAAQATMDGIDRDCQKQTFFVVARGTTAERRYECLPWEMEK